MYPDANLTLRVSAGKVSGLVDSKGVRVPFATRFGDLFALAERRGNTGDFALPPRLLAWRQRIGDAAFKSKYASMIVDFISTNDITGGNSGSSTLNRRLEIVGLIFDGNEESMASDWVYNGDGGACAEHQSPIRAHDRARGARRRMDRRRAAEPGPAAVLQGRSGPEQ